MPRFSGRLMVEGYLWSAAAWILLGASQMEVACALRPLGRASISPCFRWSPPAWRWRPWRGLPSPSCRAAWGFARACSCMHSLRRWGQDLAGRGRAGACGWSGWPRSCWRRRSCCRWGRGIARARTSSRSGAGSAMISVVIPVYNEEGSLKALHARARRPSAAADCRALRVRLRGRRQPGRFLERVLTELAANDPRVRAIRFRRNFGKAAALDRGIPARPGRADLHARCRSPGRPGRDPPLPEPARRGGRRRERLEEDPSRSLAQGDPQPGLQRDGQPPDRMPAP